MRTVAFGTIAVPLKTRRLKPDIDCPADIFSAIVKDAPLAWSPLMATTWRPDAKAVGKLIVESPDDVVVMTAVPHMIFMPFGKTEYPVIDPDEAPPMVAKTAAPLVSSRSVFANAEMPSVDSAVEASASSMSVLMKDEKPKFESVVAAPVPAKLMAAFVESARPVRVVIPVARLIKRAVPRYVVPSSAYRL